MDVMCPMVFSIPQLPSATAMIITTAMTFHRMQLTLDSSCQIHIHAYVYSDGIRISWNKVVVKHLEMIH